MTIQDISICITASIAIISLLLSFASYWKSKPKIKIEITDKKWDCFFGYAGIEYSDTLSMNHICGAKVNIINNSPVKITINSINMIIDKEKLRYIMKDNRVWNSVFFYFKDENNKWITDGAEISYQADGLSFPFKIDSYDAITAYVLFYHFPTKYKNKHKGIIEMNTAIGKIRKKVNLVEYNCDYEHEEYRDYCRSCRSVEEEPVKQFFFEDEHTKIE